MYYHSIMKCHISATIDRDLLVRARKHAQQNRRALSNLIEFALEQTLRENASPGTDIVTSRSKFRGRFDRGECYGDR